MNVLLVILLVLVFNYIPCYVGVWSIRAPLLFKIFPDKVEAFTVGGFIFCRGEMSFKVALHESVHVRQYKKWGIIGFLFLYYIEMGYWFYRLEDIDKAYRAISFEREAYKISDKFEEL
jgi:hypothetical protein